MDDLPTDYDAIVVGTGMIESVVAAALSRIGKTILHLDANDYYGENWASFNLEGFENWSKTCRNGEEETSNESFSHLLNDNEEIVEIGQNFSILNACVNDFTVVKENDRCDVGDDGGKEVKEESVEEESEELESGKPNPKENLHKLNRRFNLDLCPKLLFSEGMLVQLLISSNIGRYAEFKSVSRVLTWREGQLEPVPCSRADVFATKNVTVVQKRILAKILALFANYNENLDEFKGFENKTFLEYLKHKKLPDNLIHYILYAIAMGDNTTSCLDGVKNCKTFLMSLGKHGNTPFIFPMYGSGELPQCFCRLCAVFGGIYCLQRGIEALIVKDKQCVGVVSNKKRLNAKTIVLSSRHVLKKSVVNEIAETVSRGIFITNRSILRDDKESLTLLKFPPIPQVSDKSVTVIELSSGTCTCPENFFVVHMTAKTTKDAQSDFKHVVKSLFEGEDDAKPSSKPEILWSGTWNVARRASGDLGVGNLKICSDIDSELDYNTCISEARRIFSELFPGEEFLPRAPDPDEIVLDGEEAPKDDVAGKTRAEEEEKEEKTTLPAEKEERTTLPTEEEEKEEKSTLPAEKEEKEERTTLPTEEEEKEEKTTLPAEKEEKQEKTALPAEEEEKEEKKSLPAEKEDNEEKTTLPTEEEEKEEKTTTGDAEDSTQSQMKENTSENYDNIKSIQETSQSSDS